MNRLVPTATKPIGPVRDLAVGAEHACAITVAKDFYCWGNNAKGQLADGTTMNRTVPTKIFSASFDDPFAIGAGSKHSCFTAFDSDGCSGDNQYGQIGDGTKTDRSRSTEYVFGSVFIRYALGRTFTCALGTGVYCWGDNSLGQLGDGSGVDRLVPTAAAGLADATWVGAGDAHVLAIKADGSVVGWGSNSAGQLGASVSGLAKSPTKLDL